MSQTKINGVKIDVRLLNQALALKLEEALSELHSSEQNRKNEKTNEVQKLKETKCYKCKRNNVVSILYSITIFISCSGFLIIQPLVISIAEVYIATIYKQFKCYCIQLYTDTPTCK
jgi:hypothetical protein